MQSKLFRVNKMVRYSDIAIVEGIQQGSNAMLDAFYRQCSQYFYSHYKGILANAGQFEIERATDKDDLFAESFESLWTEIENKKIFVACGKVYRLDKNGVPAIMTSSLTSFLLSIAKNKCYEQYRESLNDYPEDFASMPVSDDTWKRINELTELEEKIQIVDDCLNLLHKRCKDILTMFYVMQMSLDEILSVRNENYSKDGLKTSKNKCLNTLRASVKHECERRGLRI